MLSQEFRKAYKGHNGCQQRDIRLSILFKQVNSWALNPENDLPPAESLDVCNGREVINVFFGSSERYAGQRIIRWLRDKRELPSAADNIVFLSKQAVVATLRRPPPCILVTTPQKSSQQHIIYVE